MGHSERQAFWIERSGAFCGGRAYPGEAGLSKRGRAFCGEGERGSKAKLLPLDARIPSSGSFAGYLEGFSPAESWSPSSAVHSAPLYAVPLCSWDAPWHPRETRRSIRIVLLVSSGPGCLLADPYLPEHHLNGGF